MRFSVEIDGFLRAIAIGRRQNISVCVYVYISVCVCESPKRRQKWSPQSTLTFSMERQTLQNTSGLGLFLNGRLPGGGSFCVQQMSHILTYIIQDHGENLQRTV